MSEVETLRGELEALTARVRRLERRLNDLEPETMPGVGREPAPVEYSAPEYSEAPILDAVGDALGSLGFFRKDDDN